MSTNLYNVFDYGAVGDGVTDDTAAIQAAITAAASRPFSCLYLPGCFYASRSLVLPLGYAGRIGVKGDSQMSSRLIVGGTGYGFAFDLSSGAAASAAEFRDLSFTTANGVTSAGAVRLDWGVIASNESRTGPVIHGITIEGGWGGGFVDGIVLNNSWHSRIANVYGYGSSQTYDTTGAGAGALIRYMGQSVNHTLGGNLHCDFWQSTIAIEVGGPGTVFQGFTFANANITQSPRAFRFDAKGQPYCGGIQLTNVQVDNGNLPGQSRGLFVDSAGANDLDIINFAGLASTQDNCVIRLKDCQHATITEGRIYKGRADHGSVGVEVAGSTDVKVSDLLFGGYDHEVTLDAGTSSSRVSECTNVGSNHITPIDSGAGNVVGDYRGVTSVVTLVGGHPTETFAVDTTPASLGRMPNGAQAMVTSDQVHSSQVDWDAPTGMMNRSSVAARVWSKNGPTEVGYPVRLSVVVGP